MVVVGPPPPPPPPRRLNAVGGGGGMNEKRLDASAPASLSSRLSTRVHSACHSAAAACDSLPHRYTFRRRQEIIKHIKSPRDIFSSV